ncbi:CBS domain-containing protein [Altererythrobacter sp. BO-6]|uniref:CBS domain-containing protein n=1 Tax=Altererythrobacter sp. BO-6 TaxID=2604537 RepID=UPI0013E1813D|nr:CBS domain-containing protein [Altererythrobacter sp. BO-6]QIG54197.1 CBS domain-containing protein [Altererythrobacter sp. BO-6]
MTIARIIEQRRGQDVISCDSTMPMRQAVALLAEKRIGALPVMRGGSVVGIFSERDVIYRLAEEGEICLNRPLEEVMTAPPITVSPSTVIDEALSLMTRRRIRHLPVIDGSSMVGFISIGDLVKHRIDQVEHEAEAMRNYIQTA